MQCFEHRGNSAIGICRVCNKGVCFSCAIETAFGVACSDRCADALEGRPTTASAEQSLVRAPTPKAS